MNNDSNKSNGETPSLSGAKDTRKELIELYDQGPTQEDLDEIQQIQLDKKVDRYGFIKTEPVPLPAQSIIESTRTKQAQWLKTLRKWEQHYPSKPLKKSVYLGIPDSMRGEVWKRVLEVPHETNSNPGLYEHLKAIAKETSPDLRQIDLDINRTYRSHLIYRPRYSIKQKALFYVLGAYAVHNKDVGYCQGMANVAALLLMYMNEDDAFWALSTLLTGKKYSMHGFFVPGFPKLLRFQIHHEKIFKKLLPKLFAHFESQNIGSSLYTLKWYMQCFLDRLPFDLTLRLWDIFVLEGDKVLHPIGYTLLKLHQSTIWRPIRFNQLLLNLEELMKLDMEKIAEFLSTTLATRTYDPDTFMKLVRENISELKKHGLYPAPSVVEGELPMDSNLVFSTITEKNQNKNRVAQQLLELEETYPDSTFHDSSVVIESESIMSDKSAKASVKESCTMSTSCTDSITRFLPKVIPPPPNYPAPQPNVLAVIPGWSNMNKFTLRKKDQRERYKNTLRQDTLTRTSAPTKSLYSDSSNYFTDGFVAADQQLADNSPDQHNSLSVNFNASARNSMNEIPKLTLNDGSNSNLLVPNERCPNKKRRRGILSSASMRVKSALRPTLIKKKNSNNSRNDKDDDATGNTPKSVDDTINSSSKYDQSSNDKQPSSKVSSSAVTTPETSSSSRSSSKSGDDSDNDSDSDSGSGSDNDPGSDATDATDVDDDDENDDDDDDDDDDDETTKKASSSCEDSSGAETSSSDEEDT